MAGNYKHGHRYERIYNIWRSMRQRCSNKNCINFKNYGEKGISVCKEWNKFETFYQWSVENGYNDALTIDRKDPMVIMNHLIVVGYLKKLSKTIGQTIGLLNLMDRYIR